MSENITIGPLSVSTVTTSCGICHKIGPLPKKHADGRENYACIYVDYPGTGPVEDAMLRAAHIFAAAPDLLDALENLMIGVGMGWDLGGLIEGAQETIAKARGES